MYGECKRLHNFLLLLIHFGQMIFSRTIYWSKKKNVLSVTIQIRIEFGEASISIHIEKIELIAKLYQLILWIKISIWE